jgi:hypothetical protein
MSAAEATCADTKKTAAVNKNARRMEANPHQKFCSGWYRDMNAAVLSNPKNVNPQANSSNSELI